MKKTFAFEVECEDDRYGEVTTNVRLAGSTIFMEWSRGTGPTRFDDAADAAMAVLADALDRLVNGHGQ